MSTKKTTIGGQAIIEGIVMKGPKKTCTVVRKPGGELVIKTEPAHHQPAFWRLPILRGAYTLFTAMKDGIVAINYSAEFFDDESIDEEPSKFEKWLEAKFGSEKLNRMILGLSTVIGIALPVGLFLLLPSFLGGFVPKDLGRAGAKRARGHRAHRDLSDVHVVGVAYEGHPPYVRIPRRGAQDHLLL